MFYLSIFLSPFPQVKKEPPCSTTWIPLPWLELRTTWTNVFGYTGSVWSSHWFCHPDVIDRHQIGKSDMTVRPLLSHTFVSYCHSLLHSTAISSTFRIWRGLSRETSRKKDYTIPERIDIRGIRNGLRAWRMILQ